MRATVLLATALLVVGCTSAPPPASPVPGGPSSSPSPAATAVPTPSPEPAATSTAEVALRPLPPDLAGLPRPGEPSVVLQPESRRGGLVPGAARPFELGHCGLGSPIDFDGSLWNPIAGDDGAGGPLTEEQRGEMINATPGTLVVLTPDVAQFVTPAGAVITLARLPGGRPYYLCS